MKMGVAIGRNEGGLFLRVPSVFGLRLCKRVLKGVFPPDAGSLKMFGRTSGLLGAWYSNCQPIIPPDGEESSPCL